MKQPEKNVLEVKNLSISFHSTAGEVQAVRDVSFSLKKGEVLAIVGESGCGKSVLCKSIMKLLPGSAQIKSGKILLNGTDITDYKEKEMQKIRGSAFSMIFQDPMTSLNPTIKIGQQIAEAILVHHPKKSREEVYNRVIELMELVGIERPKERYHLYPWHFSGGMRQRSVMAIALASNPDILFADEPTTALDVTIQAQILDLMNQLKKETGTSILFITHDLGVVAEVCDDVAVMYCGRVVERGDVKTIFANPSHPYTKGLLGSIPRLGDAGKELKSIPGNVPNPKYMPKGCKFEPRCPYASEKCREEEPGFFQIEEGHISRCWLCESGQLKTDHVEKAGD